MSQVSEFFDRITGTIRPDSSAQLKAAQNRKFSAEQEREAREQGFESAAAMSDFSRQKAMKRTTERNWDSSKAKNDVTSWHPAVMLDKVLNAIKGAD